MNEKIWKAFTEYKDDPSDENFEKLASLIALHRLLSEPEENENA